MSMAAADPRYMPEVVSDTAFALSCGGIHCRKRMSFVRYRQTDALHSTSCCQRHRFCPLVRGNPLQKTSELCQVQADRCTSLHFMSSATPLLPSRAGVSTAEYEGALSGTGRQMQCTPLYASHQQDKQLSKDLRRDGHNGLSSASDMSDESWSTMTQCGSESK